MNKLDQEIKARTEKFATELADLVKRAALESVSEALAGSKRTAPSAGSSRGSRRAAPKATRSAGGRRKKGQKRTPEELEELTKTLQQHIKKGPGRGIEAIAADMGVSTKELALPIKKLLEDKNIKTRGQKRATKYYPK